MDSFSIYDGMFKNQLRALVIREIAQSQKNPTPPPQQMDKVYAVECDYLDKYCVPSTLLANAKSVLNRKRTYIHGRFEALGAVLHQEASDEVNFTAFRDLVQKCETFQKCFSQETLEFPILCPKYPKTALAEADVLFFRTISGELRDVLAPIQRRLLTPAPGVAPNSIRLVVQRKLLLEWFAEFFEAKIVEIFGTRLGATLHPTVCHAMASVFVFINDLPARPNVGDGGRNFKTEDDCREIWSKIKFMLNSPRFHYLRHPQITERLVCVDTLLNAVAQQPNDDFSDRVFQYISHLVGVDQKTSLLELSEYANLHQEFIYRMVEDTLGKPKNGEFSWFLNTGDTKHLDSSEAEYPPLCLLGNTFEHWKAFLVPVWKHRVLGIWDQNWGGSQETLTLQMGTMKSRILIQKEVLKRTLENACTAKESFVISNSKKWCVAHVLSELISEFCESNQDWDDPFASFLMFKASFYLCPFMFQEGELTDEQLCIFFTYDELAESQLLRLNLAWGPRREEQPPPANEKKFKRDDDEVEYERLRRVMMGDFEQVCSGEIRGGSVYGEDPWEGV